MRVFHGIALVMGLTITACGSDDSGSEGPTGADSGTGSSDRDAGDPTDADAGTGEDASTSQDAGDSQTGPGAFTLDYAGSDDFFTLMNGQAKGVSPHGSVQIWYSSNIMSIIDEASFEVPEGTTSIKEFDMDSDGTLDGFAVMIKREAGYDPDNGDWYYEMRDPAGEVMPDPAPGKTAMCINCHAAAASTDYLAGVDLRGPDSTDEGDLELGPGAFTLDYATADDFVTRMDGRVQGTSPHGTAQIWYSSNLEPLFDEASFEAPEGSTSIKEFDMDSNGTLDGFAVMIKREAGYDPDNNDWYYEMRDPAGELMAEPAPGKIEMCVNCHAGWAQMDYLAGITLQ